MGFVYFGHRLFDFKIIKRRPADVYLDHVYTYVIYKAEYMVASAPGKPGRQMDGFKPVGVV